ncbi:atp-dependent RNA helicase ddx49-related [Anaeramoeba flamelloides]|uniref:Atp-dependent RNA helicase ddx49-related n=1 Tax=Anaeramoeba flamelloides TaxID=1746091 RepID=A0ABQ8YGZ6_9EUKA|nr:atp-dependent RNA helicase ddx49-related [Anaeramoeba flamelloides]
MSSSNSNSKRRSKKKPKNTTLSLNALSLISQIKKNEEKLLNDKTNGSTSRIRKERTKSVSSSSDHSSNSDSEAESGSDSSPSNLISYKDNKDNKENTKHKKKKTHKQSSIQKLSNENLTKSSFVTLGLCSEVLEAIKENGWKTASKIQMEAIPYSVKGRDIIGLAETGSGKTGAFVLPVLHHLLQEPRPFFCLCLVPTRELAYQICNVFKAFGSKLSLRILVLVGGVDPKKQAMALAKRPHIIICTLGRLVHHLKNTKLFHLDDIKHCVLDEADKLLEKDFQQDLQYVVKKLPRERVSHLYSATMTSDVEKLQKMFLRDPVRIQVSNKFQTVNTLKQQYMLVPHCYKLCYLVHIIKHFFGNTTIVFTNSCREAAIICSVLNRLNLSSAPLHSQISQEKRMSSLTRFAEKRADVLIATDVAARGLDIPNVDMIINYDIQVDPKTYIHRVGRTARAGKTGRAINFITQYDLEYYNEIENSTNVKQSELEIQENQAIALNEKVSKFEQDAKFKLKRRELKKKKNKKKYQKLKKMAQDPKAIRFKNNKHTRKRTRKN